MKLLTLVLAALPAAAAFSQKTDPIEKYGALIDSTDLRRHLTVLAGDEYEGRETGKKGQQMAAAYIERSFREDGCAAIPGKNAYQQDFTVVETVPGGSLSLCGKELAFRNDFFYIGAKQVQGYKDLEVYTVEGFESQTVENAAVIHPLSSMDIRTEADAIKKRAKGAKAIIFTVESYATLFEYLEHYATSASMRLAQKGQAAEVPVIFVRAEALKGKIPKKYAYLLGGKPGKAPKKVRPVGKMTGKLNLSEEELNSSNVIGFIPGSDPILAKEAVVITAHYDHIGIIDGVVYNGADDDGTGTVALLEIAEAFAAAKKEGKGPRRSVIIMTVSGEEKGLLGSQYYVDHPWFPLKQTIADLNIDMIGRNDIAHEDKSDYIYVIGSNMISWDLHNANEEANKQYTQLELDYKFNDKNDPNQFYYRSDHYNFAKNDIPSVFYFSGVHEDYHQATDDIEKINFSKVEKVARLVFATAWKLADETQRPRMSY
jgi:hypothetical protein